MKNFKIMLKKLNLNQLPKNWKYKPIIRKEKRIFINHKNNLKISYSLDESCINIEKIKTNIIGYDNYTKKILTISEENLKNDIEKFKKTIQLMRKHNKKF
ncbi:MAG: hypothetical protein ACOCP8_03840 [archaeon]